MTMKRKSLADLPPEEREFIDGGKPKPEPHAAAPELPDAEAVLAEVPRITQSFRLPQPLVHELIRVSTDRKLARKKPWAQQDIIAEALQEWLRKHANKQASKLASS
jgi:hypothetical protein